MLKQVTKAVLAKAGYEMIRIRKGYPIIRDYGVNPDARYGEGKPAHRELQSLIGQRDDTYLETLRELAKFTEHLKKIPETVDAGAMAEPHWTNIYFSALDAIALYGLLGLRKPSRYLEVGSGNSTMFARRAIRDLALHTQITSIDPQPRAEIDALCDRVIRTRLEDVDLALFDELQTGDILFIDSSHRVFTNSDVTVFFLEMLPRLKPGITVHIHDIFLPFDYPRCWKHMFFSEQYLLAAYLLGKSPRFDVLLPLAYLGQHPSIGKFINETWHDNLFQRTFDHYRTITGSYIATSFWLELK